MLPKVAGMAGLFSGAALVVHIVSGASLRLALGIAVGVLITSLGLVWRRSPSAARTRLAHVLTVGLWSGIAATVAYDASRFLLSLWDSSPYNPFEALRMFGLQLAGMSAPTALVYVAGTAFHLVNGISFGVVYCFFWGRRGVVAGIVWGLVLEGFQLALYPGWLDIKAIQEFTRISAISHVVYGAVLGGLCRRGLQGRSMGDEPRRAHARSIGGA